MLRGKYDMGEDAQSGVHMFMAKSVVPLACVAVHVVQWVLVSWV